MYDREGKKMVAITLSELENRVKENSSIKARAISDFQKNIQTKNLKKGRIRPKDPVEARILASFKRK